MSSPTSIPRSSSTRGRRRSWSGSASPGRQRRSPIASSSSGRRAPIEWSSARLRVGARSRASASSAIASCRSCAGDDNGAPSLHHVTRMTSAATQRRVGRYEILREVGRGGTAVVYLARQSDLDRDVALKELAGLHASDPAFVERFLRESRVAGSLNHPNIVTVHEYFEHDGTAFIAMEYFERGSLRGVLAGLTLPQVAGVLEGVLAGLGHAHARGIVHRDLKPENVMVTSNGGVKIADFGVAKVLQDAAGNPLTMSGTTLGTPAYMAPEQALATDVGPPADLYAVGVLAYEMLSGDVPFHGSDVAMAIMLQHLNEPVPSLQEAAPQVDPEVCGWVERLLAKVPDDRPASAGEAWEELDEILIGIA